MNNAGNLSPRVRVGHSTQRRPDARLFQPAATVWREWPQTVIGGAPKRTFDIAVAVMAILLLSPILILLTILIKLNDKGPALYRQERVGLGGKTFRCLKFRSMVTDADARLAVHLGSNPAAAREWALNRKLRNDPRITSVGKFLRKSSLDELPQLFNILRGEMSLVGPRPVVAAELEHYQLARVHYLRARPGLTGLWQVSGRSDTSYRKRVELDRTYVLKWTFIRDISILLHTLPALLLRSGAM
ncbi:MAG: sugar transferase [Hyphomonadaceae bacterium]|nr:sugar transferase [Hyphomonadaceae bacterium]